MSNSNSNTVSSKTLTKFARYVSKLNRAELKALNEAVGSKFSNDAIKAAEQMANLKEGDAIKVLWTDGVEYDAKFIRTVGRKGKIKASFTSDGSIWNFPATFVMEMAKAAPSNVTPIKKATKAG